MDDSISDLKSKIWLNYSRRNDFSGFDLEKYVESAMNVDPTLSYIDCCKLAMEVVGRYGEEIPYSPKAFIGVCKSLNDLINPNKALVLLADGSECQVFPNKTEVEYVFRNKKQEKLAKTYLSITCVEGIPTGKEYDLVISDLPLGPVYSPHWPVGETVEQCLDYLSPTGYAIFTLSKGVTYAAGLKWLRNLENHGLYCNAVLDMPINSYGYMVQAESVIAIFSKQKAANRFVASLAEESYIPMAVSNFASGKPSNSNPKLGVFVNNDVFSYAEYNIARRLENMSKRLSKAYNGPMVKLSNVGEVYAPNRDNEFTENVASVYIPKLGNSPVVTSVEEFHIKAQNYFQVAIDEEKILQRFLAFFLNSEDGLVIRQLHYKGMIGSLNKSIVGEIEIPCPPIEAQAEYMATFEQLELLRLDVETLKGRFVKTPASYKSIRTDMKDINNHGDKFIQWIESLPYPIATILKRYSVSDDLSIRQESIFYFFEAYSIFESTILSAVLNKEIIDCSSLKEVDPAYFERASYGNWVKMDRALSNLYLKMLNSGEELSKKTVLSCFQTEDENVLRFLCSKTVCNALELASTKRNLWKGHGGITSETVYKEHVATLDSILQTIRDHTKDLYERIRLVRPLALSYSKGQFENKVEILSGSNPIFAKDRIVSFKPLDNTKLYIQMLDTKELIELPPYFILKNSPAEAKNACYFYNRVEGGNTRYVSYHYDGKPEDTETGEAAYDAIKDLLRI